MPSWEAFFRIARLKHEKVLSIFISTLLLKLSGHPAAMKSIALAML